MTNADSSTTLRRSPCQNKQTRVGIPATCYRTENAQIPKSAGESAGKSAGKKGTAGGTAGSNAVSLLFQRNRPPSTAPSSPPSSPLFPGTLPSTLPGTFGDLGVLSPVAGCWDSKTRDLRAGKKQSTKLFAAEEGPFGTPFLTPKTPPKKFMRVPFLRPFPGNEAH